MVERFVLDAGTISIANGSSTVAGTGTSWGGADLEGAQVWTAPASGAPQRIGTVAAISPTFANGGRYDNLSLDLVHPWQGTAIVNQPFELLYGLAIASSAAVAAVYARFLAFLQQTGGLTFNKADVVDLSYVPENSLFVDDVTRVLYKFRGGVLTPVYTVATVFNPRGAWDVGTTYAKNDLISLGTAAFVSNFDGNIGNVPTTAPAPASDANWTMLFIGAGAEYADVAFGAAGQIGDGEKLPGAAFAGTVVFPAGLVGSIARLGTAPTADAVFPLKKTSVGITTQFGTVTFAAGSKIGVFAAASDTTFAGGDVATVVGPATSDTTLADLSVTLRGTTDVAGSPTQSGVAVIDFGAFPGAFDAAVVITGQGKIVAGSLPQAWIFPGAGTVDHSADEHALFDLALTVSDVVAATGFTIRGLSRQGLVYGKFNVAYRW